ncbi:MAG: ATP synthase F1 subunit delta [Armatimonadia bacterium]|nr:ATP synthase F1 subunit delta [Armatimonadia bacterium]
MIGRSVARRYLGASMEAAERAAVREQLGRQLAMLQAALEVSPDVRRLLGHPSMDLERKLAAVGDVLGEEPVEPLRKLIALLIDNDRLEVLEVAEEVYQQLVDEAEGVLRAFVATSAPLDPDQSQRLAQALSGWLEQDVLIDADVDPDLIGGIVVRVGDRVLDASLRGRLERIRERMVEM